MNVSPAVGFVVDAGTAIGYGHTVRCLRLARKLGRGLRVIFYPLSEMCRSFIRAFGMETRMDESFPPLVITDLRQPHGITALIHRRGSKHVSIHDLGLAQCHSDVVIDGSIATLFPYGKDNHRKMFLGPQYMIVREPVVRGSCAEKTVFVSLGGGATAQFAAEIAEKIRPLGLKVLATPGFSCSGPQAPDSTPEARKSGACSDVTWIREESDVERAISTCTFAIVGAGLSLYDMLASGVPTIAVSFDCLQLRTAEAFHERGAALSAGLFNRISPSVLLDYCKEMFRNHALIGRLSRAGRSLVDGKGLSRVVGIVRRELWITI